MTPSPERLLEEAIALARRGAGEVEPNPRVGAIALAGERVVGRGWHRRWGGPHAEVEALEAAREPADTLVVTLEPCSTAGKTPPCTELILARGIRRLVCGAVDPNPAHAGRGLEMLRRRGVAVEMAGEELARACLEATGPFAEWIGGERPWVVAKWAMSLDGRIATATGASRWITPPECRLLAHRLRASVDAVMVGLGTVQADDPALTVRHCQGPDPLPVVVDPGGDLPREAKLVAGAARRGLVLLVEEGRVPRGAAAAWRAAGVELIALTRPLDLAGALGELHRRRGVRRLLVEGGGILNGSLHDAGLIDQVEVHLGPLLIGGEGAPSPLKGRGAATIAEAGAMEIVRQEAVGSGVRLVALPAGKRA